MRIEKRDSKDERRILISLIIDRVVLSRISPQWNKHLFQNRWSNLIAGWCVDYLTKYDKAPGKSIEALFDAWAETTNDKTTAKLVSTFLESLSDEYEIEEAPNSEHLIDLAGRHFNKVRLEALADNIQSDILTGNADKAEKRLAQYGRVELGVGTGIDVLNDKAAIRDAFETKTDPLITLPGALGEFFGDSLERDGFIAFMGPDKRGKSFWLSELAYRAIVQRRRVAFFEVGDMSQNQIMRRIQSRIAKHPQLRGTVAYPVSIERGREERTATVEHEEHSHEAPLSWRRGYKASQKLQTRHIRMNGPVWRLSCHPNSTINVGGILAILGGWERDGWIPDMVAIDYADILAPDIGGTDFRHQTNDTWKRLRAMSQTLHCLVVTASQTDADGYKRGILTRSNFSEDKRKMAHVTGMVGINQTPEEKDNGIIRLNWVVRREGAFSELKCVHVAGCLGVANPAIRSCW